MAFPATGNEFLDTYMTMVEDTEPPRLYHVWSALSIVGATLGRRCYLPFGYEDLYPNIYVLLVGNAATRKSTAMKIGKKLLASCTDVRFAPDSTAGKYQGLVTAMVTGEEKEEDTAMQAEIEKLFKDKVVGPEDLGMLHYGKAPKPMPVIDPVDKHVLYAAASEFNTFIGHGNLEFLEFLGKVYDGDDYEYQLRNTKDVLKDPLMSMIGCTTPTNIATAMPHEAIGQGFTSRIVFVYGAKKYKRVPRPAPFHQEFYSFLQRRLRQLYFDWHGAFNETREAYAYADAIYERASDLMDSRFAYYLQRRHTHFLKIGMILTAMRGKKDIELQDYQLADRLLIETEKFMPEALGEYGLSPISMAKQKIVEFVRTVDEPVSSNILWSMLGRDIRMNEFVACLQDLCAQDKIQLVTVTVRGQKQAAYIPKIAHGAEMLDLMDAVQTSTGTGTVQ